MRVSEIRARFLEFFKKNGHEVVPSSSLIPAGDPTLLFVNAGMNQFKDMFLGDEERPYSRAASSQKCFRASGKHNDLENVGRTARHHTFFEMLGNFSFGDYFKRDAILYAWEFLTKDMGLDPEKLLITVYLDDDEAFDLWREVVGVPAERIIRMNDKENFWAMGDTGPCGPCSEIHFDQGPEAAGCGRPDCGIECECGRYLELWNLVFMQYDRDEEGELHPLPRPSIDTGMGIERIAAVMQGVYSNYDIDLFREIIGRISEITGHSYGGDDAKDVSMRVIADHARAMAFLIADGVMPANEGRGYVLRRVMRRAGRHAKMLGSDEPVLYLVADRVADLMGEAYPELVDKRGFISEVIQKEEQRFLETLDAGLKMLQEEIFKMTSQGMAQDWIRRMATEEREPGSDQESGDMIDRAERQAAKEIWKISGELAFKLYDTYGFPLDLTQTIAEEQGLEVDVRGFEKAMEEQRERAREHWKGSGEEAIDSVYKEAKAEAGATEFLGYDNTRSTGRVVSLIRDKKHEDEISEPGARFQIISERTPFYGESGGQVGDTGRISASGLEIKVEDATRPVPELVVHHCVLEEGTVSKGQVVNLEVDEEKRMDTARNHSATHLLQYALRRVLGEHVYQKGSLVTPDRFRFDLTHFSPVTGEQLREVETIVNALVRENHDVKATYMPYKQALKKGAIALFGEKYAESVRMVEMGDFSRELCGGTHTRRTGDVGAFKILSEAGVSAGVRRIEAITGRAAIEHVQRMEDTIVEAAEALRAKPDELTQRIQRVRAEIKDLKKQVKEAKQGAGSGPDMFAKIEKLAGVEVLVTEVEVEDAKELRPLGDRAKDKMKSGVAVLGTRAKGKAHLLVVVTKDLTDKIKAGDIVAELAPVVGGKGGGRPDFAQAGGPDQDKLPQAMERAREILAERVA